MSLLKGSQQPAKPPAQKAQPVQKPARPAILRVEWPEKRLSNGLGASFKDGFWFGMGFWIALVVGMPVVGFVAGVVIFVLITFIGGFAGAF